MPEFSAADPELPILSIGSHSVKSTLALWPSDARSNLIVVVVVVFFCKERKKRTTTRKIPRVTWSHGGRRVLSPLRDPRSPVLLLRFIHESTLSKPILGKCLNILAQRCSSRKETDSSSVMALEC